MSPRIGFSLIEVIIAIALFTTLLIGVLEATVSIKGFADQHESLLELEQEGRQIMDQVVSDLSNSGWLKQGSTIYPVVTPAWNQPTNEPPSDENLFGNRVEFLSINLSKAAAGRDWFDFSATTTAMADWRTPDNAVPELVSDPSYTTQVGKRLVMPVWEPIASKANDRISYTDNQILSNLRTYLYQVDPSPSESGRGTLHRYYREGPDAEPVLDTRIGDLGRHIYSFVVAPIADTQRVRITLELRNDPPGKARAVRTFVANIAMRSAY